MLFRSAIDIAPSRGLFRERKKPPWLSTAAFLAYSVESCYTVNTRGRGQSSTRPEEARPMSIGEVIALLMLVIAAIKLGHDLKK